MRALHSQDGGLSGSTGFASPATFVLLVLLIGATIYLWRQRYVRRKTAYVTLFLLGLALILVAFFSYTPQT